VILLASFLPGIFDAFAKVLPKIYQGFSTFLNAARLLIL
jgi:hypothetical protein